MPLARLCKRRLIVLLYLQGKYISFKICRHTYIITVLQKLVLTACVMLRLSLKMIEHILKTIHFSGTDVLQVVLPFPLVYQMKMLYFTGKRINHSALRICANFLGHVQQVNWFVTAY